MFDVMLVYTSMAVSHIRDDISSKTDFTVDLIWWASPNNFVAKGFNFNGLS